ncbi:hypothetical protein EXIGLDRAFT_763632 [Exidia glandulosa HHB12029]|uniref:Uncharacterized protein n=1 Tax=Exidia glandulosa HHB12029 TaxID=1314781 RepID=A0A165LU78_EXIGL|nr:hypothetical protein EXIGLDRAFT_763632 [Exidia glandulosa HHB12029]
MAGTNTPTFIIRTSKSLTAFTRRDNDGDEEQWIGEVRWLKLKPEKSTLRLPGGEGELKFLSFFKRAKWYSTSRSFDFNGTTYT